MAPFGSELRFSKQEGRRGQADSTGKHSPLISAFREGRTVDLSPKRGTVFACHKRSYLRLSSDRHFSVWRSAGGRERSALDREADRHRCRRIRWSTRMS